MGVLGEVSEDTHPEGTSGPVDGVLEDQQGQDLLGREGPLLQVVGCENRKR